MTMYDNWFEVRLPGVMKQQNADLLERWTQTKNSLPRPPEENHLSSRSNLSSRMLGRPAVLDEVQHLVQNTKMQLRELKHEALAHAQRLSEYQNELDISSSSTENSEDKEKSVSLGEDLQVEPVRDKAPNDIIHHSKEENEKLIAKEDDIMEKVINTDKVEKKCNKDVEKDEGKLLNIASTDEQLAKSNNMIEQQEFSSPEKVTENKELDCETFLSLKVDIKKTLECLQNTSHLSNITDRGANFNKVIPSKLHKDKHSKVQSESNNKKAIAKTFEDINKTRPSKTKLYKPEISEDANKTGISKTSEDINKTRPSKTKFYKPEILEDTIETIAKTSEDINKTRPSKTKLCKPQTSETVRDTATAKISEERHSKSKPHKSENVAKNSEGMLKARMVKTKPHELSRSSEKDKSQVPTAVTCSCSNLTKQEELLKLLQQEHRRQSHERAERNRTKHVVMVHKNSQTALSHTSNIAIVHAEEQPKPTIKQIYREKQLAVQQLPSLSIRRNLSVQKVPSIHIPPPGAAEYVSSRQNVAFWGLSQDGVAVEVQKLGSSDSVNHHSTSKTVSKEVQQLPRKPHCNGCSLQQNASTLTQQMREDFKETDMYSWLCEICRTITEKNMTISCSKYLSQCRECLRYLPTAELFQQHCIECQLMKNETKLSQCIKCLCSVPEVEIINGHCFRCQTGSDVNICNVTKTAKKSRSSHSQQSMENDTEHTSRTSHFDQQRNTSSHCDEEVPMGKKMVVTEKKKKEHKDMENLQAVNVGGSSGNKPSDAEPEKYLTQNYQIKGDVVSSLQEEEIMKDIEQYLHKEQEKIINKGGDIFGQDVVFSDASSFEEYFQLKGQDVESNLSDSELGELILTSLSARLQQQALKPLNLDKYLELQQGMSHSPMTVIFRAETSQGDKKHLSEERATSSREEPDQQGTSHSPVIEERATSSRGKSDQQGASKCYTSSKYHRRCFDNLPYTLERTTCSKSPYRSKKRAVSKSPKSTKPKVDKAKQGQFSGSPEMQVQEQEEGDNENKLVTSDTGDTDSGTSAQGMEQEKMTEESYEDDWEEVSQHSATEGVRPLTDAGTQTDVQAKEVVQSMKVDHQVVTILERRDIETSPIDILIRTVTVDTQTSVFASSPSSESLPPSDVTLPATATEQQIPSLKNGQSSQAFPSEDELQVVCRSPSICEALYKQVKKKVIMVDRQTSPVFSDEKEEQSAIIQTSECPAEIAGKECHCLVSQESAVQIERQSSQELEEVECTPALLQRPESPCNCPPAPSSSSHTQCSSSMERVRSKQKKLQFRRIAVFCGSSEEDEDAVSSISITLTSNANTEPSTSAESVDSGELKSCQCCSENKMKFSCPHCTISQGEVLFDMQASEGEVLAMQAFTSTSLSESLSSEGERILGTVNFRNDQRRVRRNNDLHSDGELSEGQIFLK